jgi:hypothetical protein
MTLMKSLAFQATGGLPTRQRLISITIILLQAS